MFWFTADTHFNHKAIIEYCKRPFKSIDHMDLELIRRWNAKVSPSDTVLHLGDFVFARGDKDYNYYADQLNGKIIILKGNHDSRDSSQSILQTAMIRTGGMEIYCAHEPGTLRSLNLCGHVHELWKVIRIKNCFIVNVGVDIHAFEPIDINDILRAVQEYKHGVDKDI